MPLVGEEVKEHGININQPGGQRERCLSVLR